MEDMYGGHRSRSGKTESGFVPFINENDNDNGLLPVGINIHDP